MIALIDNYDSFTYNLYQLIGSLTPDITVVRNDAISADDLEQLAPDALILSPGPGRPAEAGICIEAIQRFSGTIPILGVCLGHQAICEAFGATVDHAQQLMHGKSSIAEVDTASPLFRMLPCSILVARYHSLAVQECTLPDQLRVIARSEGEVMALEHTAHPTYGVQFHPESILTPQGLAIIRNFLTIAQLPISENTRQQPNSIKGGTHD